MPSENLCDLQNVRALFSASSRASIRKLQILPLCVIALTLQACAGRAPDLPAESHVEAADASQGEISSREGAQTPKREDFLARALRLASGERAPPLKNDEMIAALQARKAAPGADSIPGVASYAPSTGARIQGADNGRLSREEMLERLRMLSQAARNCVRQECAGATSHPMATESAPAQEPLEERLPPDEVMRRLRELAAPARRAAATQANAFGELPSDVTAAHGSEAISPETLRVIEEARHAHLP